MGKERWRPRSGWAWWWLWALAVLCLLALAGTTRLWSQSSDWSLSSSSDDLTTWERLSDGFRTGLIEQSSRLRLALTELQNSKAHSLQLTNLLEQSLQANESLKIYNGQIGQRMQQRDEDLAAAYADINRLKQQVLRLVITVILLAGAIVVYVLLTFALRR